MKANLQTAGFTPLHMAVVFDNPKVAEILLKNGADVWARDSKGSTPLYLAFERQNLEMMVLFFQYGYENVNFNE